MRNNKIKGRRDLRGSVYDLHPQDKAQRATLCFLLKWVEYNECSLIYRE